MRPPAVSGSTGTSTSLACDDPFVVAAGRSTAFCSAAGASSFSFGASPAGDSATVSPLSPMKPIVRPTSTSPSGIAIFRRTPLASASTSCVTLSVSSSYRASPFSTASPSDFSHLTIVPDSMPWPRRGSLTSVAISALPGDVAAPRGREHQAMQGRREPRWFYRGDRGRRSAKRDRVPEARMTLPGSALRPSCSRCGRSPRARSPCAGSRTTPSPARTVAA